VVVGHRVEMPSLRRGRPPQRPWQHTKSWPCPRLDLTPSQRVLATFSAVLLRLNQRSRRQGASFPSHWQSIVQPSRRQPRQTSGHGGLLAKALWPSPDGAGATPHRPQPVQRTMRCVFRHLRSFWWPWSRYSRPHFRVAGTIPERTVRPWRTARVLCAPATRRCLRKRPRTSIVPRRYAKRATWAHAAT